MKISYILATLAMISYGLSHGQVYIDGGHTRHRFAQLNIGTDARSFFSDGTRSYSLNPAGELIDKKLDPFTETRIIIGGTHFWGHADFFLAIPIANLKHENFATSVETGARIYPWAIQNNKLRPFVGCSWLPTIYKQGGGVAQTRSSMPVFAGTTWNHNEHLISISAGYIQKNTRSYAISTSKTVRIHGPHLWVSIGYKYMIETTLSAEESWLNGRTRTITDTLVKMGRLNGITLSAGPSSVIFLKESPHNHEVVPFLDQHRLSNAFPEVGIGYYFHRPDVQVNFVYRRIQSKLDAFGHQQALERKALSLEVFKFLFDYHGFAPFIGASYSRERLFIRELDNGVNVENVRSSVLKPGITFGWDIRPNRIQSWYLRTNLRYFPGLNVHMSSGKSVIMDQLEMNFIQLVIFPGRMF